MAQSGRNAVCIRKLLASDIRYITGRIWYVSAYGQRAWGRIEEADGQPISYILKTDFFHVYTSMDIFCKFCKINVDFFQNCDIIISVSGTKNVSPKCWLLSLLYGYGIEIRSYTHGKAAILPPRCIAAVFIRVLSRKFFLSSAAYPIKYFLYSLYEYNKNHQEERTDVLFIIKLYFIVNT